MRALQQNVLTSETGIYRNLTFIYGIDTVDGRNPAPLHHLGPLQITG